MGLSLTPLTRVSASPLFDPGRSALRPPLSLGQSPWSCGPRTQGTRGLPKGWGLGVLVIPAGTRPDETASGDAATQTTAWSLHSLWTMLHGSSPRFDPQPLHFPEVCITGYKGQIVLQRYRRYPDVVLWNGATLLPQPILHFTIAPCRLRVATQHDVPRSKVIYACQVLYHPPRLARSLVQLSKHNARNEDLFCFSETAFHCRLIGKQSNDDVGVQQVSTTHSSSPVHTHPQLLVASAPSHPRE